MGVSEGGEGRRSLPHGAVVWNRIDDAVRWVVHELRRLCPKAEFGTRSIAWQVLRVSIQISRSTVQRFSRRLLCLRVHRRMPRAGDMAALVRRVAKQFGRPGFVITDHGTQFRRQFRSAMRKTGIIAVQARVRAPHLNGKIERAFRTFRIWWRLVLTGLTQRGTQRRMDDFGAWFNEHRPHSALHGRTPQEAWEGRCLPEPIRIRARDQLQPQVEIRRRHNHGDPRLPLIEISVQLAA